MIKELDDIILYYTEKDITYIDEMSLFINNQSKVILDFFGLKHLDKKITIYLYANLDDFYDKYKSCYENSDIPFWLCGFCLGDIVYTLCLEEMKKTKSNEKSTIKDLEFLILHEFVHSCHNCFLLNHNKTNKPSDVVIWFWEGMATTISGQYKNREKKLNAPLDNAIKGYFNYISSYTMFSYVLNKYGKDYIFDLALNRDKLLKETPKLYEEVNNYYNKKTI